VLIVALAVLVAAAVGVAGERRSAHAPAIARRILQLMLYVLVPFVSFVNIAHLHVTVAAGTGLVFAYVALGLAGAAAGYAGRRMQLSRPEIGALICSVMLVNTGYLGLPMTVALIGPRQLGTAIAYDQLVSGPMLFIAGFGIGAAFGTRAGEGARARTGLSSPATHRCWRWWPAWWRPRRWLRRRWSTPHTWSSPRCWDWGSSSSA
jgi:predicted permease